jgi:SAM-dependent methyltransferase
MTAPTPVLAATAWRSNAELIEAVHQLGYISIDDLVLDPTWGLGRWWTLFRPTKLAGTDLDPEKSPTGTSVDFTDLPFLDRTFDVVAFDPPYKLNGTPTASVDARYGVHVVRSRDDRHQLILDGITECTRVLRAGGRLLVKCQDQVNGGKVRWQTDLFTRHAVDHLGLEKVDALHLLAYRPQPEGRRQVHARRNLSTLLIFVKPGVDGAPGSTESERSPSLRSGSPSDGGARPPAGADTPAVGEEPRSAGATSTAVSTSTNENDPGLPPRVASRNAAAPCTGPAA